MRPVCRQTQLLRPLAGLQWYGPCGRHRRRGPARGAGHGCAFGVLTPSRSAIARCKRVPHRERSGARSGIAWVPHRPSGRFEPDQALAQGQRRPQTTSRSCGAVERRSGRPTSRSGVRRLRGQRLRDRADPCVGDRTERMPDRQRRPAAVRQPESEIGQISMASTSPAFAAACRYQASRYGGIYRPSMRPECQDARIPEPVPADGPAASDRFVSPNTIGWTRLKTEAKATPRAISRNGVAHGCSRMAVVTNQELACEDAERWHAQDGQRSRASDPRPTVGLTLISPRMSSMIWVPAFWVA
jgi:hypothetical protein